ncbi:hypothetical protein BaRGS_00021625 [Batillaria attramentaria]|uniref:Uncharacterized protein n=1 Tax=Batillaria attramentaria TaxID=370345 RepID=A0ABD0KJB9_9CAEN
MDQKQDHARSFLFTKISYPVNRCAALKNNEDHKYWPHKASRRKELYRKVNTPTALKKLTAVTVSAQRVLSLVEMESLAKDSSSTCDVLYVPTRLVG